MVGRPSAVPNKSIMNRNIPRYSLRESIERAQEGVQCYHRGKATIHETFHSVLKYQTCKRIIKIYLLLEPNSNDIVCNKICPVMNVSLNIIRNNILVYVI